MCSRLLLNKNIKILIIDSGIGGLSLYIFIKRILPNASYTYIIDNEVFPYGNKTDLFIKNRLFELVNAVQKKQEIDLIILACNTASVTSLNVLRKIFSYPILGVVPSIEIFKNQTKINTIGLLATETTINSEYIYEFKKRNNKTHEILTLNISKLVNIIENRMYSDKISLSEIYNSLLPLLKVKNTPGVIILGCTHLKFLFNKLRFIFPQGTLIIDSYLGIVKDVNLIIKNLFIGKDKQIIFNRVYCSLLNNKIVKSIPLFKKLGFSYLEKLNI